MITDLISYYNNRAREYENIYTKPERQDNLTFIRNYLREILRNNQILEIACGTGYWTRILSETAKQIDAFDINEAVLEIAKGKEYPNENVSFQLKDFFDLKPKKKYDGLFGGFIWSHISLMHLGHFIEIVNGSLKESGMVVMMDNNFVEGSSTPISGKNEYGNTYQTRTLKNGDQYKVLKNFPIESFIREKLSKKAVDVKFINLKYYWVLTYRTG